MIGTANSHRPSRRDSDSIAELRARKAAAILGFRAVFHTRRMDEIVIRGMMKWPNVPAVYGWLSLDRRGSWMIKNVSGRFERIANSAVNEFIGRNYAADS